MHGHALVPVAAVGFDQESMADDMGEVSILSTARVKQ
jgi:hypothetical protein